jgi:hypothetical protein
VKWYGDAALVNEPTKPLVAINQTQTDKFPTATPAPQSHRVPSSCGDLWFGTYGYNMRLGGARYRHPNYRYRVRPVHYA